MYIPNAPDQSYWEGEWLLPGFLDPVAIALPGNEQGPSPNGREFYLSLPARIDEIVQASRPRLEEVFRKWLRSELPENIFTALKLAGFGVEDPSQEPVQWDIAFETTGDQWLGITIPFIGNTAQEAIVDT